MYIVKTDGSFVGSPVNAGVGGFAVIKLGKLIHQEAARDERVSSSTVAEAFAISKALEWLEKEGLLKESIVVASDSRSTLDVVRKAVKTRSGQLREFCELIMAQATKFSDLVFLNCHRGEVSEAQTVARIALRPERKTIKEGRAAAAATGSPPPSPRGDRRGGGGGRRQSQPSRPPAPVPVKASDNGRPAQPPRQSSGQAPRQQRQPARPPRPGSGQGAAPSRPAAPKAPPALNFLQQAALKKKK